MSPSAGASATDAATRLEPTSAALPKGRRTLFQPDDDRSFNLTAFSPRTRLCSSNRAISHALNQHVTHKKNGSSCEKSQSLYSRPPCGLRPQRSLRRTTISSSRKVIRRSKTQSRWDRTATGGIATSKMPRAGSICRTASSNLRKIASPSHLGICREAKCGCPAGAQQGRLQAWPNGWTLGQRNRERREAVPAEQAAAGDGAA
jgi:hypothetical protein